MLVLHLMVGMSVFNVGAILDDSVKLSELSPQDLHNYLKSHYTLKQDEVISQVAVRGGKKKEKKHFCFFNYWLNKFKWLAYSASSESVLCKFSYYFHPYQRSQ